MPSPRLAAYGRLLRLSLAPSAAADILAGALLGGGGDLPAAAPLLRLLCASLAVYHGAMVLNDWADRRHDAAARPERPLPTGEVSPPAALLLGAGLLLAAPWIAAPLGRRAALWMAALAVAAGFYDLAGRGPWRGPLLLALCRAGNLAAGLQLGVWLGGRDPAPALLGPALLYGLYVFGLSRLGRLEDGEDPGALGDRPARILRALAGVFFALPLVGLLLPVTTVRGSAAAAILAVLAALGLLRAAARRQPWDRRAVQGAMGRALRRLLLFTAALALLPLDGGPAPPLTALAILAGYPLSHALRRIFPPS